MPQSEEAQAFFGAVYAAVTEVPYGKVTSYAHIARLVGKPQCPRQVGVCLKHLPSDTALRFNEATVPWQRVVNAKGGISPRGPNGATRQAAALRREGVQVNRGAMGEYSIDFSVYGWFPNLLPSEEAEADAERSDDDSEEAAEQSG
ncbi:DNA binding methylated-DNA--cysteine S-methyltransferase [Tothia fuscella]|uniref:DNA binding methylated-DNA--cysteine S-methyltransferase n=1 Tax=Tothia fuscella TaxID=1048955 RepID=A0A9P4NWU8_9PEZI|nr:DNA binding methylated-DNA--cysteine S-methyltransferase [Tothia fuscella]